MTTSARKLLTCKVCGQSKGQKYRPLGQYPDHEFHDRSDVNMHMKAVHPNEWDASQKKARQTREANQAAARQQRQDAEAKMRAASERLVEKSGDGYDICLTYQLNPHPYNLARVRRPTPEALAVIETWEKAVESAQAGLEAAKHTAWWDGTPVTEAEVAAARQAGEVPHG